MTLNEVNPLRISREFIVQNRHVLVAGVFANTFWYKGRFYKSLFDWGFVKASGWIFVEALGDEIYDRQIYDGKIAPSKTPWPKYQFSKNFIKKIIAKL